MPTVTTQGTDVTTKQTVSALQAQPGNKCEVSAKDKRFATNTTSGGQLESSARMKRRAAEGLERWSRNRRTMSIMRRSSATWIPDRWPLNTRSRWDDDATAREPLGAPRIYREGQWRDLQSR
jgi:hypothetical protein